MKSSKFICPVCSLALTQDNKVYKCENRHSFDISRQGYVNLLSGASKGTHGDNKEMIISRKSFLDKGYYLPLANSLAKAVQKEMPQEGVSYLDAGCGEGYYTEAIQKKLCCDCYGIDISKDALIYASKRLSSARLAVASVYHMPFADSSFDLITSVFAPFERDEYLRVLKKGGRCFMVIPGKEHLFELKSLIYDTPYKNQVAPFEIEGFRLIHNTELSYKATVNSSADLHSLFAMTPYYYRTSEQNKARLIGIESLDITVNFIILGYEKISE